MSRSKFRPVAHGFAPRLQRQQVKAAIVVSSMVSLWLSPLWLAAAFAQTATYNPALLNSLATAPLTASDMNAFVCGITSLDVISFNTSSARGGCNLLTQQSGFYATTPGFYKVNYCSANAGTPPYLYVGNFLAITGDYTGDLPLPFQPETATPPSNLLGTVNACQADSNPIPTFTVPPGFVAKAASSSVLAITNGGRVATVPQDPNNVAFAKGLIPFVLFTIGSPTQTQVSYQTNSSGTDTAAYGTDYALNTGSSNASLPSSGTLLPTNGSIGYLNVFPKFNPVNHPELRLTETFASLSGATFLGPKTIGGRLLALNNAAVSVTAINGQATITPGSTAGGFTVTRAGGDQTVALPVNYTIGGTAANGSDYGYLSGSASIPAGQSSINIPIVVPTRSGATAIAQKSVLIGLTAPADSSYNVPASGATGQSSAFTIPAYSPSTVTFAQGTGGGTLTPGQNQPFTVTRSGGDTTQPLTVNYTTGGTGVAGTDYQPLPGAVTIPAGATSATVPLAAIQHTGTTAFPATTLSLTPAVGSGYDATGAAPINYNIPAYAPGVVSVSTPTNGGTIAPGGSLPFTVTRTGDTSQPLTVPYTIGGTATPGTDYSTLPGSITIPAGQQSATQILTVPTQNGSTAVPAKTITLTPSTGSSYTVDPANGTATYSTTAYTPSAVSATPGTGGSTITPGTTGGFTITRTGATTAALPVTYTLGGTATNGTDYNQLPGSVTIPAGQSAVTVPITVPAATGSTATTAKTIIPTITSGTGYAPDATTPSTTLTIPAFTPAAVSFSGTGGMLTPGGSTDGFTVTRTGATTAPLTVAYTVGGSATPGQDYGQLPGSVTIPAGQSAVTVPLKAFPQSGTTATPQEDVQITLNTGSGYAPSSTTPAVYTIPAYSPNVGGNPAVTVSIPSGQDTVLVPGTSTDSFQVTRTGVTTAPLTVNYTVGGTGVSGTDYQPLSGTLVIPAGATSATVPIVVPSGATLGKTVAIGLSPGTGYDAGTNTGVVYTIGLTEPVTIARGPSIVGCYFVASVPAFEFVRTGDLSQPLTVPIDFSGSGVPGVDYANLPTSVTFKAGEATAQVPVKLLPTAQTGHTITATIPSGSGYTVGSGNGTTFTIPAGYNDGSNTPQASTSTAKKGGGLGVGSVAGLAVAGAGLSTIALGTGGAAAGAAGAAGSLAAPGLLASAVFGTIPQACAVTGETPLQLAKLLPQLKDAQPDWSASFGSLAAPTEAGAIKVGTVSRAWKAGQPVADIVHVADTDGSFNLHCMGLAKLASLGRMELAGQSLKALKLVSDTSALGLSKTIYLRAKKIGDVKGMGALLAAQTGGKLSADQLAGMSFAEAFKAMPELGNVAMGGTPLSQLPGYGDILVGDIPNWKAATVSQIIGLKNVPFNQFPSQPKPLSASAK